MSREAFEAWRQRDLLDAPAHTSGSDKQWRAWQAARSAALEEAAEVCMDLANVRLKSERTASYCNQRAAQCAQAIRALKENP